MKHEEIIARIETIEKELQELKKIVKESAQEETERPPEEIAIFSEEYDPNEFGIEYGILYDYLGNSKEVTIPYGVTKIGTDAFIWNKTIKKVNFPDTVTEIGEYAFYNCENLVEVNNSKNVTKIGECAFHACLKLEKIDVDNVTEVESCAFCKCENIKRLRFSKNIKTIKEWAFYGCKNLNISIPKTCEYVTGKHPSFEGCKKVLKREVKK